MFKPSKTLLPPGRDSHFSDHLSDFVLSLCAEHQMWREVRNTLNPHTLNHCTGSKSTRKETVLALDFNSCSLGMPGKECLPLFQMRVSLKTPVAFPKVLQAALRLPMFSYSLRDAQGDPSRPVSNWKVAKTHSVQPRNSHACQFQQPLHRTTDCNASFAVLKLNS